MSMTSKVNPAFQQAIVDFITKRGNVNTSNAAIYLQMFNFKYNDGIVHRLPSMRAIQEATQKLAKAGVLSQIQRGVYRLAMLTGGTANTTSTAATV